MWFVFQGLIVFAIVASNIHYQFTPNGYLASAIGAACPDELRPLLARFYTIRAFKTACVWGYWGEWRRARALRARFRTPQDYALLYYSSSLVYSTPVGAVIGGLWRKMRG